MPPQPAARVGDFHFCPASTGPVPYVGGAILPPVLPPGAKPTLAGGVQQARMGDLATCTGPPDTISRGTIPVIVSTVPAARMTDPCAHGGTILLGCATVLIVDGPGGHPGQDRGPGRRGGARAAAIVDGLGRVEGLLGMSFLSRFDLKQQDGQLEITARRPR
jgi:uncharacterized Zn-binding protein involved in type VI secretion